MGCGGSKPQGTDEEKAAAKAVDSELQKQQQADAAVIKLLLLGAGESGKSTIFKQMKIINAEGYSAEERKSYIGIIHSNTIQSMKTLIGAQDKVNIFLSQEGPDASADVATLESMGMNDKLTPELGDVIKRLWAHPMTAKIFERRAEFQLNDSAEYYFKRIDNIKVDDYMPDEQDVLRSRVRTTGIVQSNFVINDVQFSMYDVGGQRNERRKWIHCFDNVQAVIFVAAMSEYDQVLYEDETQNRMTEAIQLFDQICNSKYFQNTAMILFLNKRDLFEIKLCEKRKPLHNCFPDDGGTSGAHIGWHQFLEASDAWDLNNDKFTYDAAAQYLTEIFMVKNQTEKKIYAHCTCATDTTNVKFVFDSVVSIVLEGNMKNSGLG